MWRDAYREHYQVCADTAAWVLAQQQPFDADAEPLRAYADSWRRVQPLLARRRGPRLTAHGFDRALGEVVFEVRRLDSVVFTGFRGEALEGYLDTMAAYSVFQPRLLVPALATPLVVPAVALLAYPASLRSGLAALPEVAYFALLLAAVTVNALWTYALMKKVTDRPRLFGPYAFWAIPPCLASFVLLFAVGYWIRSDANGSCMDEALSRVDAVYFSLTTFTTTGFGDISPETGLCRGLASLQMTITFLLVIVGVGAFISRATAERPRL